MFKEGGKRIFLVSIYLLSFCLISLAQTPTPELKNRALEKFEAGNYNEAYKLYKDLLDRYPKDGTFNYYAGICLYKSDKDLPRAIELLNYASSKARVPEDVFYHLGQAYKKNYQFAEAKAAFEKFEQIAGRSQIKELKPELEIINTGNARELTMEYNPFEILASSLFSFADTNYIRQVRGKGGTLSVKPSEIWHRNEKEGDLTTLMFLPKTSNKGDNLYMAGYSRPRNKDSDLLWIRKGARNNFGDPEELEELNTEYNEILPYYDPVGNDLYFASEGHNSMGGFDVFKSHYDEDRKEWSEPVNLGFPINSPDNEYFAMPGPDLGTFLLITDRQGLDSMLTVYKLILQEPKRSLASADTEEIKRIGNLGGISAIPAIVDLQEEEKMTVQTRGSENPNKSKTGDSESKLQAETTNISVALAYQKKADSLSILAKEKRIEVRSIPNPNDRWAWQRQIIEWEKQARDFSEKADETFALINSSKKQEEAKNPVPETIEKDKEINGITVYRYSEKKPEPDAISNTSTSRAYSPEQKNDLMKEEYNETATFRTSDEPGEVVEKPIKESKPDLNRFLILDSSPYSESNPFPMDIKIPQGAFYRIQLGVFSQQIDYDAFGGISPVTAEKVPGKSLTRYYAGKFNNYEKAREALNSVKSQGFNDAYIVSWYNGEKVSLNKVTELEKRDNGNNK